MRMGIIALLAIAFSTYVTHQAGEVKWTKSFRADSS